MTDRDSGTRPTPARLEAFSDGVLAIAITLLVLEIKVPDAEDGKLWSALGHLWPSYAAYAVSFLTIGIMWVNHHNLSRRLESVDHGVVYANIALLGAISFLPFPTAVLADYLHKGGVNEHAAAALYGLTMMGISIAFLALWMQLKKRPALLQATAQSNVDRQTAQAAIAIPVYGIAVAISFASATAALAVYGFIAVGFAFNKLT